MLRDHTGDIQLFVETATLGDRFAAFTDLDSGDWVGATGEVITTKRGELSVKVQEFSLLARVCDPSRRSGTASSTWRSATASATSTSSSTNRPVR